MALFTKTIAALGLIVSALVGTASADTYQHIDQLAFQIDRDVKRLVSESGHYRHSPEYQHLLSDARELCALSDHLHEVAHHHGSLAHLESDVAEIDAKFHHLESVFDRIEQNAAHGYGHVHGNTSHVRHLLRSIEDGIHHLQDDLRSMRTTVHSVQRVVVPQPSVYPTQTFNPWGGYNTQSQRSGFGFGSGNQGHNYYGNGSSGRGITIGGGSSRFTIRF